MNPVRKMKILRLETDERNEKTRYQRKDKKLPLP